MRNVHSYKLGTWILDSADLESAEVANSFSLSTLSSLLPSRLASKAVITDLSLDACVQSFALPVTNFDWLCRMISGYPDSAILVTSYSLPQAN